MNKILLGISLVSLLVASVSLSIVLVGFNRPTESLAEIESLRQDIATLEIYITEMQTQIDIEKAFDLLKKELASPATYIAQLIVDELFSQLEATSNEFQQWLVLVGEIILKEALASVINAKMPAVVWNNVDATSLGDKDYSVSVVTYFPIDIDTGIPIIGTITIAKIALTLSGRVNVLSESITNIAIVSLDVEG